MARKKTKGALKALPIDLSRLAGAPIESIKAKSDAASAVAVNAFDSRAQARFGYSGRLAVPMAGRVKVSREGVTIRLFVSATPASTRSLSVFPTSDTTGALRTRVSVSGARGRRVDVPNGFVWNGKVFMRNGRSFKSAKSFIREALGEPSAAFVLGLENSAVIRAAQDVLLSGLGDV